MSRDREFQPAPRGPESGRLRVLHLLLKVTETSAPYNEHCLTRAPGSDVSVCTYFRSETAVSPSVTVFEGTGMPLGFYRALARALDAKPHIVHIHALHFAPMLLPMRLVRPSRLPPLVFTLHNSYTNLKFRNKLLLLIARLLSSRLVGCGAASLDSIPAWLRRLPGGEFAAVPNGVDTARIDRVRTAAPPGTHADGFRVVSVGRLIPIKNPLTVLRAFETLLSPHARLDYVGAGHLEADLLARARSSGVDGRVSCLGLVPRDDVYRILSRSDLFVSASHGEGLPVAALEALACGVPAILSDIPPHREIIDGADGIPLVAPNDVDGFAREMRRFAAMPEEERRRIGEAGRAHVAARFGLERMHQRYAEIYRAEASAVAR